VTDKRKNPKYDEPQSVYQDDFNPEDGLREMLEVKIDPSDASPKERDHVG